jgi:hypothetical protein
MLPKIKMPTFEDVLPSGKKFKYRPFISKEQKVLSIAALEGNDLTTVSNLIELVDECTFGDIDWHDAVFVDFEYAFLKIRSKSTSGAALSNTQGSSCMNFSESDSLALT